MRYLLSVLIISISTSATVAAPEFIDGSDSAIAPEVIPKLSMALIKEGARDAQSAQYHSLQSTTVNGGYICGYVNLKNGFGAYTGFTAFQMHMKDDSINLLTAKPGEIVWNLARMPFTMSGCSALLNILGRT